MSLADFATPNDDREATITVLDPESVRPVYRLLTRLFDDDAVTIRETTTDESALPSDVLLVEKDGDDPDFAVSPLDSVRDELLLVNADIYTTGTRGLDDIETPDIVSHLDDIPFTVTGGRETSKEKLLLIELSRHIEAMAWQAGEGTLRTGFQYLSRLDDERGTHDIYARLGEETTVETHVYGVPDARPSLSGITVHGAETRDLRRSWFVVYRSGHHPHEAAALVARETGPNTWRGCWTYDPDRVARIHEYLATTYG